jgi:hypothetical protein
MFASKWKIYLNRIAYGMFIGFVFIDQVINSTFIRWHEKTIWIEFYDWELFICRVLSRWCNQLEVILLEWAKHFHGILIGIIQFWCIEDWCWWIFIDQLKWKEDSNRILLIQVLLSSVRRLWNQRKPFLQNEQIIRIEIW